MKYAIWYESTQENGERNPIRLYFIDCENREVAQKRFTEEHPKDIFKLIEDCFWR